MINLLNRQKNCCFVEVLHDGWPYAFVVALHALNGGDEVVSRFSPTLLFFLFFPDLLCCFPDPYLFLSFSLSLSLSLFLSLLSLLSLSLSLSLSLRYLHSLAKQEGNYPARLPHPTQVLLDYSSKYWEGYSQVLRRRDFRDQVANGITGLYKRIKQLNETLAQLAPPVVASPRRSLSRSPSPVPHEAMSPRGIASPAAENLSEGTPPARPIPSPHISSTPTAKALSVLSPSSRHSHSSTRMRTAASTHSQGSRASDQTPRKLFEGEDESDQAR